MRVCGEHCITSHIVGGRATQAGPDPDYLILYCNALNMIPSAFTF